MNDGHMGQRKTQSASDLTTSLQDSTDVALGEGLEGSTSVLHAAADMAAESESRIEGAVRSTEAMSPVESATNTHDQCNFMSVVSGDASADSASCTDAKHEAPIQQVDAVASSATSSVPSKGNPRTSDAIPALERPVPVTLTSTLPSAVSSRYLAAAAESVTTPEALKPSSLATEVSAIQTKSVLIGRRGVQGNPPGVKVSTVGEAPNDGATDGETPVMSQSARSGPASTTQVGDNLLVAAQVRAATHSQDWISPTAMWGGSPWTPCNSPCPAAGTITPRAGHGEKMPGEPFEISPTVPFVPMEEAKGETSSGLETLQADTNGVMQQQQGHAERVNGESFEISPTVPFVPIEEPSVVGALEQLPASSNHMTTEEDQQDLKALDGRLESSAPETIRPTLERTASDSLVSLKGDEGNEPVNADHIAEPEEASSQRDEKRRHMEREWLRHKRHTLLQQEELTRRRKVRRTVAEAADRLRVASMNEEDQGRYVSVVAESMEKNVRTAVTDLGDDSSLLGGFGHRRPPRILLGR